jgi:cholesterol transport system auxiliary component
VPAEEHSVPDVLTKRFLRFAMSAALAVAATGCALLVPPATPATYDLAAPAGFGTRSGGLRGILVVPTPVALQILDSQRIIVRSAGGQISYVPDAQWPDRLTNLVQARLIETFENAGQQRAVGRPSDRLDANNDLVTDIRAFDVAVAAGVATAEVSIAAKIVTDPGGRVVAARVFSAKAPVRSVDGPGATAGLQQALQAVLADIVRWVGRKI